MHLCTVRQQQLKSLSKLNYYLLTNQNSLIMKTISFFIAMMTTFLCTAQMVDIAFHYHQEVNHSGFEYNSLKHDHALPVIPKINVKSDREQMNIHDFKRFGLYEALLRTLRDECLTVHSYKLVKESARFDPEVHQSYNGQIDDKSVELVQDAKDGDLYILYDIQVKNLSGTIYRIPLVAKANIRPNLL